MTVTITEDPRIDLEWSLYKYCHRSDHDCICHFNLEIAKQQKLTFFQSRSDATVQLVNVPACSLEKVVTFHSEILFE